MIHINWNSEIRSILAMKKCIFLIPNLMRKPWKKLPHGSYRNRGHHARYVKFIKPYKKK